MTATEVRVPESTTLTGAVPRWLRRIFVANLIAQIGIVVTGGIVRLTGSGLGCPTWPECVDGSIAPTTQQAESWHKYVEFGNRLLTFVLAALAIAALVGTVAWVVSRQRQRSAARRPAGRWAALLGTVGDAGRALAWLVTGRPAGFGTRRPVAVLATVPLLGTFAQAVLGGITVLTGLHPATVAAHFLLSIAIIAGCTVLVARAGEPGDEPVTILVRPQLRAMAWALVVLALLIVIIGTVVTGSGPHAGDAADVVRFGIDQRYVAWLHADAVLLFVGMQLGLLLAVSVTDSLRAVRSRAGHLLGITVINGVVGYSQLFTGLPWALVAVHMLLACLLWVAVLRLLLSTRARGPIDARSSRDPAPAAR